jgi:hypothetical protein
MYNDIKWTVDMELDESILIWHIATHFYFIRVSGRPMSATSKVAHELSCYMFFLLSVRPYMLPYPISRQRYVQLCYDLITSGLEVSRLEHIRTAGLEYIGNNNTLKRGCDLVDYLISRVGAVHPPGRLGTTPIGVSTILEVWVEILWYTAYRCNKNSHAKHLSNGGEIMTAVSLLMLYMSNGMIKTRAS